MEKVYILIIMMDQVMMENGIKMYNKGMEYQNGQMENIMKGIYYYKYLGIIKMA
jgi:hypothetical protein